MNATTKRLQAHTTYVQADHYQAIAQAYGRKYCRTSSQDAQAQADTLRRQALTLYAQSRTLRVLEGACSY